MDWFLGGLGLMSGFGYQFQSVSDVPVHINHCSTHRCHQAED
jgi:hypothetical protein